MSKMFSSKISIIKDLILDFIKFENQKLKNIKFLNLIIF